MPIYEYYSPATNKVYSFFARGAVTTDIVPRCPDDPKAPMRKVMSGFAVIGRAKDTAGGDDGDLDDPRMEAAMAELEREMSVMDEGNPDPRQMGQLMRKMSDMTGEKLPGVMEEMVRRLEAGEDPEKLEDEYGEMQELADFGIGEDESEDALSPKSMLRRLRGPVKDPVLYELRDYID
ncbi:MAG: cytochrome C [Puniceicoccaceae bacterium]